MNIPVEEAKIIYDALDKIVEIKAIESDGGGKPVLRLVGPTPSDITAAILALKRGIAAVSDKTQ